jgi:hypothetical protein
MPSISIDRAVWYHVSSIDVNYQGLADLYESLAFPNKPPLGDCRIHISALAYAQRLPRQRGWASVLPHYVHVFGIHLIEPSDSQLLDGQAPPADIMLFLGNSALKKDYSEMVPWLIQELVLYAQGKSVYPAMTDDETRLRRALAAHEAAERQRIGGPAGIAGNAISTMVSSTVLGVLAGGSLGELGRGVAEGFGFSEAEQAAETRDDRKELFKLRQRVLSLAQAREAASHNFPPTEISADENLMQFQPRKGKYLRPVLVCTSDHPPGRISIEMRHLQRSLAIMPLQKRGKPG